VHVAVNVCSVRYRVCVLEITVGLWDRQIKEKEINKMQHNKLLGRDKFINLTIGLVGKP